jgi:serine protease Do
MTPRWWLALGWAAALVACQRTSQPAARVGPPPTPRADAVSPASQSGTGGTGALRVSLAPLVEQVQSTVVGVTTHRRVAGGEDVDELFRRFFGRGGPPLSPQPPQVETGLGSGFVIDAAGGLVLTNNHVVQGADEVLVRLSSEREVKARVIGTDSATDVAVLRLREKADSLSAAPLGDSDSLRVGDSVVAIGNPFGLELTVTSGIISAKARVIGAGPYDDFLQTDAAINPGNSGGPLFDLEGRVVGINSAIVASGQGIGFAVPINLVKALLPQLEKTGRVVRGFLGVTVQDVTPELARAMNLKAPSGALISDVSPGGPGASAGLKSGDVVTAVDGKPVKRAAELSRTVAMDAPGQRVSLQVARGGKVEEVKATLGERPKQQAGEGQRPGTQEESLGLTLQAIPPEARGALGTNQGALVARVAPESRAARAGIQQGDVIIEANGQSVRSPQDFAQVARSSGAGALLVRLLRNGNGLFVAVAPDGG